MEVRLNEREVDSPLKPKLITTYLEMSSVGELKPKRVNNPAFKVEEAAPPQWNLNRSFYLLVGTPWLWKDKANWTEEQWREYVETPRLKTFPAYYANLPAGYFELKAHEDSTVEIAYFGLALAFIGKGLGGALLTRAIEEGWKLNPSRLWVHTCNRDHPAALKNYLARGLKIYKVEES